MTFYMQKSEEKIRHRLCKDSLGLFLPDNLEKKTLKKSHINLFRVNRKVKV